MWLRNFSYIFDQFSSVQFNSVCFLRLHKSVSTSLPGSFAKTFVFLKSWPLQHPFQWWRLILLLTESVWLNTVKVRHWSDIRWLWKYWGWLLTCAHWQMSLVRRDCTLSNVLSNRWDSSLLFLWNETKDIFSGLRDMEDVSFQLGGQIPVSCIWMCVVRSYTDLIKMLPPICSRKTSRMVPNTIHILVFTALGMSWTEWLDSN